MRRVARSELLVRRVLGTGFVEVGVSGAAVTERFGSPGHTRVSLRLRSSAPELNGFTIEGAGSGFVEAVFDAFMARFAEGCATLSSLSFAGFDVRAALPRGGGAGLGGHAEITFGVRTPDGEVLHVSAQGRSTLGAAVAAMGRLVTLFLNAERAFTQLRLAFDDAVRRGRGDLADRFRAELAELVNLVSFDAACRARFVPEVRAEDASAA